MPDRNRSLLFLMLLSALSHSKTGAASEVYRCEFDSPRWFQKCVEAAVGSRAPEVNLVQQRREKGRKRGFLRINYPKGRVGLRGSGAYWRSRLKSPKDALTISYDVRFGPDFDFVRGGKLPGLGGGSQEGKPNRFVAGGASVTGVNGWSVRVMWRKNGEAVAYAYHMDKPGTYGEDFKWLWQGKPVKFNPGKWQRVQLKVTLNQPGEKDGRIQAWLDDRPVLDQGGLRFRTVPSLKIDSIHFSTFFGGHDDSWAPTKDEVIDFGSLVSF